MAGCLCDSCAALCCRYIALPIDNPDCAKDFDNIRWYLVHDNIVVFVEDAQWYIGVMNRCKHLQDDNRCGIYETRPQLCRKYSFKNCDYHGGDYQYQHLFTSADDLVRFSKKFLAELAEKESRKKKRKTAGRMAKRKDRVKRDPPPLRLALSGLSKKSNGTSVSRNGRVVSLPLA